MRAFISLSAIFLLTTFGAASAQDATTASCRDGTNWSGARRAGACRGHGGVQGFWNDSIGSDGPNSGRLSICLGFSSLDCASSNWCVCPFSDGASRPIGSSRRRIRPGLGELFDKGLSLPRRPLLREDQDRRVHGRGSSKSRWRSSLAGQGVLLNFPTLSLSGDRWPVAPLPGQPERQEC